MKAANNRTGRPAKVPGGKSTKERIFDAALDLFAERGYDHVSTRDIAAVVGIKDSSIYKHYASKDEILEKIMDYPMVKIGVIGPAGVDTEELIVKTGLDGFMAMAGGVFTGWMDDPNMVKIFRIICVESFHNAQIKKSYLKVVSTACSFWESNFRIMRKHKLIRPYDPRKLAIDFLSFFWSAYLDYFLFSYGPASKTFPQAYRENIDWHVRFFVDAIRPSRRD